MTKPVSIKELTAQFHAITALDDPLLEAYMTDSRQGVQKLLATTRKRLTKLAEQKRAFAERFFL